MITPACFAAVAENSLSPLQKSGELSARDLLPQYGGGNSNELRGILQEISLCVSPLKKGLHCFRYDRFDLAKWESEHEWCYRN